MLYAREFAHVYCGWLIGHDQSFQFVSLIRWIISTKSPIAPVPYVIGLVLGIAALVMSYTSLPENYDTEPVLAFGLLLLVIAGIASIKD